MNDSVSLQSNKAEEIHLQSTRRQVWYWFTHNTDALLTIIMLIAMIAVWIVERTSNITFFVVLLYIIAYSAGGYHGVKGSIASLKNKMVNIDILMILSAAGAAFVGEAFDGAVLLLLFSLSHVLQHFAMDRTRNAIRMLMRLRPSQVLIRQGDQEILLPIEKIKVNAIMLIKPGDSIALDGVVVVGESSVDQSAITGESMPVEKKQEDTIFSGTINKSGYLEVCVTKSAKDSTIARLIQMVEEAQGKKANTQRFIEKAEQYYAVGAIVLALLAIVIPVVFFDVDFKDTFYKAMTILVAVSPCAIVISVPAVVLSAIGNGAKRGVLFKGGAYVEGVATIKAIAFDKTGTLTVGKPQVTNIYSLSQLDEDTLLTLVAAVEAKSEHPLAKATVIAAKKRNLNIPQTSNFRSVAGLGVMACVNGMIVHVGNLRHFSGKNIRGLKEAEATIIKYQNTGKTSVLIVQENKNEQYSVLGVIAYADIVRSNVREVITTLRRRGIKHVIMLTGDNKRVAHNIAKQVGIDDVFFELLPENKMVAIRQIQRRYGPVVMVGDGINDAPSLATADIGVAMGAAGTDVALDTADIVLMSDKLENLPYLIDISRRTRQTIVVNFVFAIGLILLMLFFIILQGLPLPFVVLGHEGGTIIVSLNGLRLLGYKSKKKRGK